MNLAWELILQGRWRSTGEHLGTAEEILQKDPYIKSLMRLGSVSCHQSCLASALQTVYQNRDSGVMHRWVPGCTTLQLLGLGEETEPPELLLLGSMAVTCAVLIPDGD